MSNRDLHQLVQVSLHAAAAGVALEPMPPALTARALSLSGGGEEGEEGGGNVGSRAEAEYSAVLREMGFEHGREVPALPGGSASPQLAPPSFLAIDMASPALKIAIEYDGPSHFLTTLNRPSTSLSGQPSFGRETGPTVAKRRLLSSLGWNVLNIPFHHDVGMSSSQSGFAEMMDACLGATEYTEVRGGRREMVGVYVKDRMREVGVELELPGKRREQRRGGEEGG